MKKILSIVGARPQFIKHFPLELGFQDHFELKTLHTGQHYDANMSEVFFEQLGMNPPDFQLDVGSGSHGVQTGRMMMKMEPIFQSENPDAVLVYGDTNSTLAGGLVASKLHIPVIHVEAGLRSNNLKMPEEVNRILTDRISEILFVPSESAQRNLIKEGIDDHRAFVVGDIMKDLFRICHERSIVPPNKMDIEYFYATIHRPYNTDRKERLEQVLNALQALKKRVVFSIHPRTRNLMNSYALMFSDYSNVEFIDPQGYLENLSYLENSLGLITDSGGMQKEAYWAQRPCVTIRTETEWKETLKDKCNKLVFENLSDLNGILSDTPTTWDESLYGDGFSSQRMCSFVEDFFVDH